MKRSYLFVRHGQAVYQQRGFDRAAHPPDTDWPLSSEGVSQAHAAAPGLLRLGVERIISSELARARQTAEILADVGGLPYAHRWGGLNEIHPSTLRAAVDRTARQTWSWWDGWLAARAVRRHVRGKTPRGWDPRPAEDRVFGMLSRLDRLDEPRVAIVCHGYWILLAALLVRGQVRYRWIANCSVTRIDADGRGKYRLVSFASVP